MDDEIRSNDTTGGVEKYTALGWEPKRDESGSMTRINPDTKVTEESTFGVMWDAKDNNGTITRSGPGGVVEESFMGQSWETKREDGVATRSNPKTGVTEESFMGLPWDTKFDDDGNATRRNRGTGVIEKSYRGIGFSESGVDSRSSPTASPGRKEESRGGGSSSQESSGSSSSYGSETRSSSSSNDSVSKDIDLGDFLEFLFSVLWFIVKWVLIIASVVAGLYLAVCAIPIFFVVAAPAAMRFGEISPSKYEIEIPQVRPFWFIVGFVNSFLVGVILIYEYITAPLANMFRASPIKHDLTWSSFTVSLVIMSLTHSLTLLSWVKRKQPGWWHW